MPHSLVKIWIHAVWGVKDKQPLLKKPFHNFARRHIQEEFKSQGSHVSIINGTADHLHALFLLPSEKTLAEVMKMVKGESSHWINQQSFLKVKFAWQVGYGAFSVSESVLPKVEAYIRNQEAHHRKMTFHEECELFLKKYQNDRK